MSQEELSTLSGINISTIKKYEGGARNPKPDQLLKITNALGISINAIMEFKLTTISDVISLLMRMDEQTDMNWTGQKDADGNYIPSTISLSFNDTKLNEALSSYMQYCESQMENSTLTTNNKETACADISLENHDMDLETKKNRLLLFNDTLQKRDGMTNQSHSTFKKRSMYTLIQQHYLLKKLKKPVFITCTVDSLQTNLCLLFPASSQSYPHKAQNPPQNSL